MKDVVNNTVKETDDKKIIINNQINEEPDSLVLRVSIKTICKKTGEIKVIHRFYDVIEK
jgi:hypothetical protein